MGRPAHVTGRDGESENGCADSDTGNTSRFLDGKAEPEFSLYGHLCHCSFDKF